MSEEESIEDEEESAFDDFLDIFSLVLWYLGLSGGQLIDGQKRVII